MKCTGFEHDLALWVEGDLPPDPARRLEEDLEVVRQRVLARIRGERAPRRPFGWVCVGAAGLAAAAAVWALLPRPPELAPLLPPVVRPAAPVVVRPRPARMRPRASSAPLLVKLYTDDPEVIIYWIIERKGD
jgi:hypothetical protein